MIRSSVYLKAPGDISLYATFSQPETPPIGRVYLVHGYAEHHLRYTHVVDALVAANYEVIGFDFPGFGRSNQPRMQVPSYAWLAPIIDVVREWGAETSEHEVPEWLLGHSMGGAVVLAYVLRPHAKLAGVVLSAPALVIPPYTNAQLSVIAGGLLRVMKRFGYGTSRIIPFNYKNISRDPQVQEYFYNDPFCDAGKVAIQTSYTLLRSGPNIIEKSNTITEPMLLLHGTHDKMVSITGSRRLAERCEQVKRFIEYDGLHHELLQEPEQQTVIADIIAWLDRPEIV